jgi:hypothetical protein
MAAKPRFRVRSSATDAGAPGVARRRGRAAGVLVATVVGCLTLASSSFASLGSANLDTAFRFKNFHRRGEYETPGCGAGRVVLGGGVDVRNSPEVESVPVLGSGGVPRHWRGWFDAAVAAVCADKSALPGLGLEVSSAAGQKGFSLLCPTGKVATGGGGVVDDFSTERLVRDQPLADGSGVPIGWNVNIQGGTRTGTIYAICANQTALSDLHVVSSSTPGITPYYFPVGCPAGEVATGSGAGVEFPTLGYLHMHIPGFSGYTPPDGAQAILTAHPDGNVEATTGTVYAICGT